MYDDDEIEYAVESCRIGEHAFEITTVEFLPIEKLMEMHVQDKEISGRKIWCGSLVVAEYLTRNRDFVQDNIVLELGAGTGLLGMLSVRLGAKQVYLTDHDTKSLHHMREDSHRNHITTEILHLDWFAPNIDAFVESKHLRIIAGDVIYKENLIVPFMTTCKLLLQIEGSRMLLCHVPRAGVTHDKVVVAAEGMGIEIVQVAREGWFRESLREFCSEEELGSAVLYQLRQAIPA